jgi:hypothetical protein
LKDLQQKVGLELVELNCELGEVYGDLRRFKDI